MRMDVGNLIGQLDSGQFSTAWLLYYVALFVTLNSSRGQNEQESDLQ